MMVVFYYFFIKAKMVNGTMSVGHGLDASIGYENVYSYKCLMIRLVSLQKF